MYMQIVKTDFLSLDGSLNSFTLTPKENITGTKRVRADRIIEFKRTREHANKEFGSHIIYNFSDCNLETATTSPNTHFNVDPNNGTMLFQYNHMNIPLGPSNQGYAGRWSLILPTGWRLTEIYLSDPYHKEEKIEKKKQFSYSVYWDTINNVQLVEMELRSRRGSFSFIVKGKASKYISQRNFIPCSEINIGLRDKLIDSNIGRSQNVNIFKKINKFLELKPNIGGLGLNLNEILNHFLSNSEQRKSRH
ncbi:hypothetical protein [Priestia sp. YIM B13486]|uniref:hypothetical protein n=1 Tax=Priestia sp. YIM B13486 TaxID=3366304 RepID=UPI00366CFBCF